MDFLERSESDGVATLTLTRGKVNALNDRVVDELRTQLEDSKHDSGVSSIVLTGSGQFFSFGFDIPELLPLSKEEFAQFVTRFTDLYTCLFLYPKAVVAALNGHAIAGGCMLALACDYRIMASGRAKIGLNEIAFGASLFAGSVEMLRFWTGGKNASAIAYSGAMYPAEEAKALGLVDEVAAAQDVGTIAKEVALGFTKKNPAAFAGIKALLRGTVAEEMRRREGESTAEFCDIWYSDVVRANLEAIKIRES